jgi:hypothetical protein
MDHSEMDHSEMDHSEMNQTSEPTDDPNPTAEHPHGGS